MLPKMYPKKMSGVPAATGRIVTAFMRKRPGSLPAAWTFPSHQALPYQLTGVEEPHRSDDPLLGIALDSRGNSEKRIESRLMLSFSCSLYGTSILEENKREAVVLWTKSRYLNLRLYIPYCLCSNCWSKLVPFKGNIEDSKLLPAFASMLVPEPDKDPFKKTNS